MMDIAALIVMKLMMMVMTQKEEMDLVQVRTMRLLVLGMLSLIRQLLKAMSIMFTDVPRISVLWFRQRGTIQGTVIKYSICKRRKCTDRIGGDTVSFKTVLSM
jgi:hypothetical protein